MAWEDALFGVLKGMDDQALEILVEDLEDLAGERWSDGLSVGHGLDRFYYGIADAAREVMADRGTPIR
ncbi:hypothetical protein SAMN05421505_11297 [Sinosporangium album]|uniref:Uncharacterized protein n=1 Tax=Sinosporangium album TaxID=504805 RepID=A0A1G8AC55_9ACTN|nr:hypothetical protein [Sinosporangium album]SDH18481.1 hypothetical protein SAMN05421505_11297 [Sinosporangium album]